MMMTLAVLLKHAANHTRECIANDIVDVLFHEKFDLNEFLVYAGSVARYDAISKKKVEAYMTDLRLPLGASSVQKI